MIKGWRRNNYIYRKESKITVLKYIIIFKDNESRKTYLVKTTANQLQKKINI